MLQKALDMFANIFGFWTKVKPMLPTNFHLFKDFLSADDHIKLLEYVKSGVDFSPSEDRLSTVKFKQVQHSVDSSVTYLRPYVPCIEGDSGMDYPPTINDWSYFRHYPTDDAIKKILIKLQFFSAKAIMSTFDVSPRGIYDGFLLKYSDGRSLRMHTDTYATSIGDEYKSASFSSVYYINDDFDGGEFHAPLLGITVKPLANTMVLLNNIAEESSCHEVTKVTIGERYSWQQVWEID